MKTCSKCGLQNYNDASFCAQCGTALPPAPHASAEDAAPEGPYRQPHAPPPPQEQGYAPRPGSYPPQGAHFPPQGGYPQHMGGHPHGYGPPPPDMRGLEGGEKAGIFIASLCISPIVAIVLYFVWKDSKPTKAQEVCTLGWWVVGAYVAIYGFFFLMMLLTSSL